MNDKIDDFFEREREAVPLLAPPPGRFDELQTVARKRRNRNTTAVSVAAAAVVAVVGTGGELRVGALGHDKQSTAMTAPPAGTTAAVQHSTAPATTVDAAVPSGFNAWSVSFVSG